MFKNQRPSRRFINDLRIAWQNRYQRSRFYRFSTCHRYPLFADSLSKWPLLIWITSTPNSNSSPRIIIYSSPKLPPINPPYKISQFPYPQITQNINFFASMAISTSTSFFTSTNFTFNSHSPSQSASNSVRFGRSPISAAYATAERTTTTTEPIRSFRNPNPTSLYEVLGIRIGADAKEVKAAYRRLARVLHPDVGSCDSSADEFMKVHSAYTTLTDPEKRADYDRSLVQRRAGVSSPVRSGGSYRSRRWETDQCW